MGYITPDVIPNDFVYRRLVIPNNVHFLGAVNGALLELTDPENWEQVEGITPDEAAALALVMIDLYWDVPMTTGAIIAYASTLPPTGTLACDGSTYLRVTYPLLYSLLNASFVIDADHFKTPTLNTSSPIKHAIIFN